MSRNEIGNYLGLAVETVSRIFTRFQKSDLLHVEGKEVHIQDLNQLYSLSGEKPAAPTEAEGCNRSSCS